MTTTTPASSLFTGLLTVCCFGLGVCGLTLLIRFAPATTPPSSGSFQNGRLALHGVSVFGVPWVCRFILCGLGVSVRSLILSSLSLCGYSLCILSLSMTFSLARCSSLLVLLCSSWLRWPLRLQSWVIEWAVVSIVATGGSVVKPASPTSLLLRNGCVLCYNLLHGRRLSGSHHTQACHRASPHKSQSYPDCTCQGKSLA
eukprot:Blabericola_migrator_1__7515@NODE_383_length_9140_cov_403_746611_g306_i0_p4_GENE_NODE_383_length_9140_cov_403_746611_g306_i0NODE_383_length_9140_cov_403_746611_g306_i0_p4_ORF_typecomplete_len200_score7_90DUF1616/PF07760_11/1_9_NODE_383_length_9140_cov_403_746611_g306_i0381980